MIFFVPGLVVGTRDAELNSAEEQMSIVSSSQSPGSLKDEVMV